MNDIDVIIAILIVVIVTIVVIIRAIEKFQRRKAVVPSWYFDLGKLLGYWHKKEGKRTYHHTAPISSIYSLHEGIPIHLYLSTYHCNMSIFLS